MSQSLQGHETLERELGSQLCVSTPTPLLILFGKTIALAYVLILCQSSAV